MRTTGLVFLLLAGCGGSPALHKARDPAQPLRFRVPDHWPIPRRKRGAASVVSVPWHCEGVGRIRVLGVRGDCGCAAIAPLPRWLDGGQSGVLRVSLSPRQHAGRQRVHIRIYLDRPAPQDYARVRLEGWVGPAAVLDPLVLDLGAVDANRPFRRNLALSLVRAAPVQVRLVGLTGSVRVGSPPRPGFGHSLTLEGRTPAQPGPFSARMHVEVLGERLQVPISGTVLRPGDTGIQEFVRLAPRARGGSPAEGRDASVRR